MSFFSNLFPKVKAEEEEEELVDPLETLRATCKENAHAKKLWDEYEECNARVLSRSQTAEDCQQELFDFLHELDHCVSHSLFSKLK